jgi:hypothetical protein
MEYAMRLLEMSDVELAQELGRLTVDGSKEQIDAVLWEFELRRVYRERRFV